MAALLFQVITTSKYHVIPPIQGNFNFNNNYMHSYIEGTYVVRLVKSYHLCSDQKIGIMSKYDWQSMKLL